MLSERKITALLALFFVALVLVSLVAPFSITSNSLFGHLLGMTGAIFMLLTLIYPFKKRILGKKGRKNPLKSHIYYGLIGPSLVVLHSGHSLASITGGLTFASMLVVVLSGIVGRYLYQKVNRTLKEEQKELSDLKRLFQDRKNAISAADRHKYVHAKSFLAAEWLHKDLSGEEIPDVETRARLREVHELAQSMAEAEYAVQAFSTTKTLFSRWVRVHVHLTVLLFAIVTVHVLTAIYYGLAWLK